MRIAIAGVPRAGKTTLGEQLSAELGFPLMHADDLISMGWSEASAELARRMQSPGPWIVEGVAVSRALRKALELSTDRPCDRLYFLAQPHVELSSKQAAMGKGCETVHAEIAPELLRRGVQFAAVGEPIAPARPALEATSETKPAAQVREPYGGSGSRWTGSAGRGFG